MILLGCAGPLIGPKLYFRPSVAGHCSAVWSRGRAGLGCRPRRLAFEELRVGLVRALVWGRRSSSQEDHQDGGVGDK